MWGEEGGGRGGGGGGGARRGSVRYDPRSLENVMSPMAVTSSLGRSHTDSMQLKKLESSHNGREPVWPSGKALGW